MKRVQAIVTGKKKQCTKLPKPTVKEKTTSEIHSLSHPDNSQDGNGTTADNGDGGLRSTSPLMSTSSANDVITTETTTNVDTTSPSTPRTASKIPGTSPKKTARDGGGWILSRKNQQRQEKPHVSKTESAGKKPAKEKQKIDLVKAKTNEAKMKKKIGSKSEQKVSSQNDVGYVTENRYIDQSEHIEKTEKSLEDSKPLASPTESASQPNAKTECHQSKDQEETSLKDTRMQETDDVSKRQSDQNSTTTKQTKDTKNQQSIPKSQNIQPLHGILKDSSNSSIAESNNSMSRAYSQNDNLNSVPNLILREHSSRSNSHPTRAESFRDKPTQHYQELYASLPRNSRSTTLTPEDPYNYGSFPRRSHINVPKQQNARYNGPDEWGSLSRKSESDFVYSMGNFDGDRSSGRINNLGANQRNINYGVTGYSNDYYGVMGSGYEVQRSGTSSHDPRGSGYRLDRNGVGTSNYCSDTETARYNRDIDGYGRGHRAGSVPLGYESDSGAYGVVLHGQHRFGSIPRNYVVRTDLGNGPGSGLRVHPDDEQYRASPGKRPIPRRHTVGTSSNRVDYKDSETERKREAFMQLLAQRYPQYADRIQGAVSHSTPTSHLPEKPSRSREGQRRRTALVMYNPNMTTSSLEYDDIGTLNDAEVSSFQRGGFSRTSLPIVRSASTSLERPLGLVFLVYGDQTKKALLPNEITTLDTVRALFVRAFPDLTLDSLEDHRQKIYLLDPTTNIYFQLEDLTDIKDRSVLKIHKTDNEQPQKVKERQEVRGRTVQMARSQSGQPYRDAPLPHNEMMVKSQSLVPQHSHNYQEIMQEQRSLWERERRSRSRTPEPAERSQRSMSAGSSTKQRFSHSPDRLPTPDRLHLNPIPENRQIPLGHGQNGSYYENVGPGAYRGHYPTDAAGFQRSQSYRIPPSERDGKDLSRSHSITPVDNSAKNRIEKMEQQLANLTAWVHYQKDSTKQEAIPAPRTLGRTSSDSSDTFPASSASSLSDTQDGSSGQRSSGLSSRESTPLSAQTEISLKLAQLKSELHVLRRQQLHNMEVMKDEFSATLSKIKKVLSSLPEVENQTNFQKRTKTSINKSSYISDKQKIDKELCDLETSVEELREDVISKQCRVNTTDVEGLAFLLNNATKSIADLKARFSDIHGQMKNLLNDEANILVSEEKFLKEEPIQIEISMKRCKNISDNLSYIKRITTTQEQNISNVSNASSVQRTFSGKEQMFPDRVESSVDDHDHRKTEVKTETEKTEQAILKQAAFKSDRKIEVDLRSKQQYSVAESNIGKQELSKSFDPGLNFQSNQEKPNVPVKPVHSSVAAVTHSSPAAMVHVPIAAKIQTSQAATTSSAPSTPAASNNSLGKMSFSTPCSTAKASDKPTATVSAMTSNTSDTFATTVSKVAVKESSPPEMKNVFMPFIKTTEQKVISDQGELNSDAISPKDVTKSPKKKDSPIYTYQVCGPVNPVFPIPPFPNKSESIDRAPSNKTSPTEIKDKIPSPPFNKTQLKSCSKDPNRSSDSQLVKSESVKKVSVSFSEPPVTSIADCSSSLNGHYTEKVDQTAQKQTARSAFFNSINISPSRNSISLDHGPVLSPTGVVGKMEEGPTINLILTGSVSPMSPTSAGLFNISTPLELNCIQPVENKVPLSTVQSPKQDISHSEIGKSSPPNDSQSITISESNKQKKVPPPPPPRQNSRPVSSNISPINDFSSELSNPQMREMPRFVGGILGQHRMSEPFYSSKSILRQENQKNSENNDYNTGKQASAVDNDDHGSSSESSLSSSGTVGSQQSVATVVRSSSVTVKDSSKSKPDPPKRQSSLLMKLTSSKESKNKLKNGKAKVNGIDF